MAQKSIWGDLFSAVLGGVAASGSRRDAERQTVEATKQAGRENRRTSAFEKDQDYYYNQKLRHEKARALDSSYSQVSNVRDYLPNFVQGTGLDALPAKPKPEAYDA